MQLLNMQRFPSTVWQTPRTKACFRSPAIKITCEEVTDYSDKDKDTVAIAWSKVVEQFNPLKEFPSVFHMTTPSELLPLKNENNCIDSKPGSEWLPT